MVKDILSERIKRVIDSFQNERIEEIRITVAAPIYLSINGKAYFSNLKATKSDVDYTLSCVTRNSIYAVNDNMIKGFISYDNGIRVGLGGEFVYAGGGVRTIKNVNSIIIRVANNVYGIADKLMCDIKSERGINNVLLLGAPLSGKTTLLREIARVLSVEEKRKVVVIDEKNEISATNNGKSYLDVGYCTICVGVTKKDGIESAIRNLSPEVIITDEIYGEEDYECIKRCLKSGISVITSVHSISVEKCGFKGLFDVYVGLSNNPVGEVKWIKKEND